MDECAVAIVGAGPVGMMLAGELALAGVEVVLLERRASQELEGSRAGGLQSRTIEVFDQRGIAERFLAAGQTVQVQRFAEVVLDIGDFPTRHPYGLALWQNRIEVLLAEWIAELGVTTQYGCEVTAVEPDETGVLVRRAHGHPLHAQYVVGCDGGRSLVRKAAGIGFEGWDASVSNLVAEVEYSGEPEWGMRRDDRGTHGIGPIEKGSRTIRVVVTEDDLRPGAAEPTLADLRAAMRAVWGSDFGVHSPTWISRFTDAARQATSYRAGRILLAGDAAHVHYPAGGQGLNIGVQDAVNLGWKLGLVVRGLAPAALLDTYGAERHPVAAQVLRDSLAQVGLRRPDERSRAAAAAVAELLSFDEGRKRFAARLSGLGVRYAVGGAAGGTDGGAGAGRAADGAGASGTAGGAGAPAVHPLVGRRMPDLPLLVGGHPRQTFELLHAARPLLLTFATPPAATAVGSHPATATAPAADRLSPRPGLVEAVAANYSGRWELPEIGEVPAPTAVLVRPDGYVAWVGTTTDDALADDAFENDALTATLDAWFGAAAG